MMCFGSGINGRGYTWLNSSQLPLGRGRSMPKPSKISVKAAVPMCLSQWAVQTPQLPPPHLNTTCIT